MYSHIFFDLDGTVIDPFAGITACVKFSLEHLGIESDVQDLKKFIGPPLKDSYMKYCSMSESEAEEAIVWYRKRYSKLGIFECDLYEGMKDLLEKLSVKFTLVLATSKPEIYAEQILEHFDIKKYFAHVVGASFDEKLSRKSDIIKYALKRSSASPSSSVMIGDRIFDTEGAVENGIDAVGVTYGYGEACEHEKAVYIAESVLSLAEFFDVN